MKKKEKPLMTFQKGKRYTLLPSEEWYAKAKKKGVDVYELAAKSTGRNRFTLVNAPFHDETYKARARAGKHSEGLRMPMPPFTVGKTPNELLKFLGAIN
jgi:hypothetical protein